MAVAPQEMALDHGAPVVNSATAIVESQSVVTPDRRCGCSGKLAATLEYMWGREQPDGTQTGHIAYPSNGMYYYRRPYNASHYRQHRMRLSQSLDETDVIEMRFHNGFQYVNPHENHLFRLQMRSADPTKDTVDPPTDSSVLEFADWRRHKAANVAWTEAQQRETQKEGTPARLSSHEK